MAEKELVLATGTLHDDTRGAIEELRTLSMAFAAVGNERVSQSLAFIHAEIKMAIDRAVGNEAELLNRGRMFGPAALAKARGEG